MEDQSYDSKSYATDSDFRMAHAEHVFKTVTLLTYQFLFTFACVTLTTFSSTVTTMIQSNFELLVGLSAFGTLATVIYMCFIAERQTEQQLALFTLLETISVCCVSTFYGQDVVSLAMLCTFGICGGLAFYAMTTRNKHTDLMSSLYSGLSCLVFMGLLNLFIRSELLHSIQLYAGTVIFLGYIIFDVQYFLRDKSRVAKYHKDDLHVVAAMNIYLDVVSIFLRLMEIIDRNKSKDSSSNSSSNTGLRQRKSN